MNRRYLLYLIILLVLAGCSAGRGCRPDVEPPPTVTPTIPAPPTIAATVTPTAIAAPVTRTPIAPSVTPESATVTATAIVVTATPATPVATPALLGHHAVVYGETMYGIGLWWYAGRYFAWGADVWTPICTANPEIADCRMIYPGDILRIPKLQ